jgi:signal transduction histidine kinase
MTSGPKTPLNILLVDDQPAKLLTYETILEPLGETLIRANSGNEALERLLKHEIAVVLVDVCMPGLDGFELASMIHQHPRYQKTAIILVSGVMVDDRDRLKGYTSGAVDYVSVPIIPEILRAKVAVFADLFRKTGELERLNLELEQRVAERTAQIEESAARLRLSEERLRLVLTASGTRGWTWEIGRDQLTRVMPAGEPEVPPGSLEEFLARVHRDDQALVRAAFRRAADGESEYAAEFREVEGGEERWLLGRGTVLRDASGQTLSIAGIDIDITPRRRAEGERAILLQQAQDARREAEAVNRLKDEFLATLSHELRTPLNAIVGWVQLLQSGRLDESTQTRGLQTISRNAQAQTQLISDLLDVSAIVTGKLTLNLQRVDPPMLLQAAFDSARPTAEAKGVHLEANLSYDGGVVSVDPARFQQMVWNLLSNAIKFTPKGGRVDAWLENEGSHVALVVQDDGPGVDPAFLPYIFDRFRQADSSSTRPHQGLGLGLAIVRHLTEMHGGRATAANRNDRSGAIFRLLLPSRVPAVLAAPAPLEPQGSAEDASQSAAISLQGMRVLVVDDDPDARELLSIILEGAGAKTTTAASAAEAFDLLQKELPDFLVSDIGMPGENGLALLAKIRALPADQGGRTPAVALTAYVGAQDRVLALSAGFHIHLPKPVEPGQLIAAIATLAQSVDQQAS